MESLGLLCGHLLGDYILQNDWQAVNKTNPNPGPAPDLTRTLLPDGSVVSSSAADSLKRITLWRGAYWLWWKGHFACTIHCLLYTLAVWVCSFWWMPWWGLLVCFLAHWPIDRFRLAAWWMKHVSGQSAFADKMGPWSIIVVDNTFHLLTLFTIGCIAR